MNYSAHTVLGLKIPKDKLYEEVGVVTNMCKCIPQSDFDPIKEKFCSSCGGEFARIVNTREWFNSELEKVFDDPDIDNIMGWPVLREWVCSEWLFIGVIITSCGVHDDQKMAPVLPVYYPGLDQYGKFVEDMKKIGVWDEELFGLWTVLNYS